MFHAGKVGGVYEKQFLAQGAGLAKSERRGAKSGIKKTDPRGRAQWAVNEPVLYGGNPPQLFRHFRMAERRTPSQNE
jgi:hypothetical protein